MHAGLCIPPWFPAPPFPSWWLMLLVTYRPKLAGPLCFGALGEVESAGRCFCKLVCVSLCVHTYPWASGKNQEPIEGLLNNGIFEVFFMPDIISSWQV